MIILNHVMQEADSYRCSIKNLSEKFLKIEKKKSVPVEKSCRLRTIRRQWEEIGFKLSCRLKPGTVPSQQTMLHHRCFKTAILGNIYIFRFLFYKKLWAFWLHFLQIFLKFRGIVSYGVFIFLKYLSFSKLLYL